MTEDGPEDDLARLLQLVEDEPRDAKLRLDLARALVEFHRPQEAFPHLQQAGRDPHVRRPAMLLCADVFDSLGMSEAAKRMREDLDDPPDDQLLE